MAERRATHWLQRSESLMAYLMFIDESGQDHKASPYEVLAGVAIHDTQLWDFICQAQDTEVEFFGRRISSGTRELKARRLLKAKVFRQAEQMDAIAEADRAELAAAALMDGAHATRIQITALAQAKIAFSKRVLELCSINGIRFFASIVRPEAPKPVGTGLRKDYAYLFERFFYFVQNQAEYERGLVIFDELERSQAHLLVDQMEAYFRKTHMGRARAKLIIPEPFFVHSDLTTLVQIADLVAYVISWNVRVSTMRAPKREELDVLGQRILNLRYRATLPHPEYPDGFNVWSFAVINDLRPRSERGIE